MAIRIRNLEISGFLINNQESESAILMQILVKNPIYIWNQQFLMQILNSIHLILSNI